MRDTVVKRAQTQSVVLDKTGTTGTGSDSWLELGKASDWSFDTTGATKYYIGREGREATTRIVYSV